MTLGKFSFFAFIQWLVLAFFKLWFFNQSPFGSTLLQNIVFWLITAIVATALVRRFGVLNYLEVFFIAVLWVIGDIILDFIFTARYTGLRLFAQPWYWFGYLFLAVSIILFHKKRHIQVRHELHAKHH